MICMQWMHTHTHTGTHTHTCTHTHRHAHTHTNTHTHTLTRILFRVSGDERPPQCGRTECSSGNAQSSPYITTTVAFKVTKTNITGIA